MNQSSDIVVATDQRSVRVTCEGLPDDFSVDAYWDGKHWNGFVTPLFTLEAGMALCEALPQELSYDAARNAFRYEDIHADEPEVKWIYPCTFEIGGEVRVLFVLGENWCWELDDHCGEDAV